MFGVHPEQVWGWKKRQADKEAAARCCVSSVVRPVRSASVS